MKRPGYIIVGIGVLIGVYVLKYLTVTTFGGNHVIECPSIVEAVEAKHQIPPSLSTPGRPGIFCDMGVHLPFLDTYVIVIVYGVTDRTEQDAIVATLQNVRHDLSRNILLRFIEKENWTTWSDSRTGNSGGHRGQELPTREVWIR